MDQLSLLSWLADNALMLAMALVVANVLAFASMAIDKSAAQIGGTRIPERRLLFIALLGGSPAMLLAQRFFRHKTRKEPFALLLKSIIVLQLVCIAVLILWVL